MKISENHIQQVNQDPIQEHRERLAFLQLQLDRKGIDSEKMIGKLQDFQVAIPSWALGAGGTRFGRFSIGGEPADLMAKLEDVGVVHALSQSAGAISLHIPWDIPKDINAIKQKAEELSISFDAMNSNTFQDQPDQKMSYKFGSLCHTDAAVRRQAIEHNIEVIRYGEDLGSKSLTVWLADGSSYAGQHNFRKAYLRTRDALKEIYQALPSDWKLFIEYKPYEPYFYSMVIPDWGTSLSLAQECGPQAYTLVDLGHHLPNTNIEQIVSTLMMKGRLGGFHFNDSKYGDDDLTCGSNKPWQLFLIFNELVFGMEHNESNNPIPSWMIDASHNLKDPLEDLLQSLEAILIAYAKALLLDRVQLERAQNHNDATLCQQLLQDAFQVDVRVLVAEARLRNGGAMHPINAYRTLKVREQLIACRGTKTVASGL